MRDLRVAVCHEWITTYGGSEQVAARIATALKAERIFSYTVEPRLATRLFPGRPVTAISRVGQTGFTRRRWQWLLPFMPRAWKRLDLDPFDLVVTSSHSCVNAIRVRRGRHVSYCHTPMRYAWQWRDEIRRIPLPFRPIWPAIAALLRAQDRGWARGVDLFIANSRYVAERIQRSYGRDAQVIYPPIDTDFWTPGEDQYQGSFFLCAGRLVAYKRTDICIQAAAQAGVPLVVAGDGPELPRLRRLAKGNDVTFVGRPTGEGLRDLYRRARALVFAGIEDFGMTLVEAQACGTPVIAFDAGGAKEAVIDGKTGILFKRQTADALAEQMRTFDRDRFSVDELREHVDSFSLDRFADAIKGALLA